MTTLREVMTQEVVVLGPTMSLADAAAKLEQHHVTGAPVVEAGRVVGVLSSTDLRAVMAKDAEDRADPAGPSGGLSAKAWADSAPAGGHRAPEMDGAIGAPRPSRMRPQRVADVMTRRLVSLPPTANVADAADLMQREGIHRLLVMDGGALFGMVSASDLMKLVATDARRRSETPPIDRVPIAFRDDC